MKKINSISKVANISENGEVIRGYRKEKITKDIEEHLLRAEDDIRNGRVRSAREVFNKWKEEYGI